MKDWITIYTVNLPQDSYLMKSLLESCEIEVFLKDELTIQSDNFLSPALNGVKVQVRESQVTEAISILKEHGYIEKSLPEQPDMWLKIQQRFAKVPILNKIHPVVLFIALLLILMIVVLFPFLLST